MVNVVRFAAESAPLLGGSTGDDGVLLLPASGLKPVPIEWLWPGWLAAGKLHMLAGAPGHGKTTIALSLAAAVTGAQPWPSGERTAPANVLIWSGEDDPTDTLRPRLEAAGADLTRCFFVDSTRKRGELRPFNPARDIPMLTAAVTAAGGAKLLIIDPVVSVVQGDSHKNAEVRNALQPLVDFGQEARCAILGITHFSKGGQGQDPAQRLVGSIAFTAVARVVMVAAKAVTEDGRHRRVFARTKSNLGADAGGYEYRLEEAEPMEGIRAPFVMWEQPLTGSAMELLADACAADSGAAARRSELEELLRDELAAGEWVDAKLLQTTMQDAGFSKTQLFNASKRLGVSKKKKGMTGGWVWQLPRAEAAGEQPHEGSEGSKHSVRSFPNPSADNEHSWVGEVELPEPSESSIGVRGQECGEVYGE